MKIAHICPYDFVRYGGVKTHILQLSDALRSLGHDVKILAPKTTEASSDGDAYFFGKNYSIGFGGTKIDINGCFGSERKRLKAFLKEERFDVIHYHTIWNPILPLQVLWYSKTNNIGTFHDTPGKGFIPQLVGRLFMPIAAWLVFRKLKGIISVSASQSRYISRLSKRKIHIIPNGILLTDRKHEPIKEYQNGKFNLLFLGRLEPRKGLMEALAAYRNVKLKHPNVQLIIAGEGDLRKAGVAYIERHSLSDVFFLGSISEETKWRLFSTVDMYMATALFGESFGIVLLEAMSVGVPITGFANEGYVNVVNKHQAEYFVQPGDVSALAETISKLIDSQEEREKLVSIGYEEIKKYDWDQLAKQIEHVYRE